MARTKTEPPGLVRFSIPVWPKDGGPHRTLVSDQDTPLVPRVDDGVGLDADYGVTSHVQRVYFYPTCDPVVYVTCSALYPETTAEADEIVEAAIVFGWRVSG